MPFEPTRTPNRRVIALNICMVYAGVTAPVHVDSPFPFREYTIQLSCQLVSNQSPISVTQLTWVLAETGDRAALLSL